MVSARKKGVVFSYILIMAEMLSSMLFTPFLIRSLGQAEYGIYSLVGAITAYLFLLDLGTGNAIIRYMAKFRFSGQKDKQRELLSITVLFYLAIGVVIIVIGMLLKNNMGTLFGKGLNANEIIRAKTMFSITMLNVVFTLIIAPFEKVIVAFEKFVFSKLMATVKIFVRVGLGVIALLMGGKGIAIVTINFCLTIGFGVISILYVTFKLKITPKFGKVDFSFIKEIVGYSAFVFIQMIATQINAMVDQILIGAIVQSSAVILGVYAVGAQINTYFQSLAGSINGVLMPGVVGLVEKKAGVDQILNEMVKVGRLVFIFLGIIWGVFVVIGDRFIQLWAGEANAQAYIVACILITPNMITLIQSIGSQILWAMNKHKMQAYLKIIVSVLNIGLSVILIKWNPLIGASIGTAIAIIVGNIIVMNIVFTRDIGISMKKYYAGLFKGILPSILIVMIFGAVLRYFVNISGWIGLCFYGAAMVAMYAILMYFKGMNNYEKNMIIGIKNKFIKRQG